MKNYDENLRIRIERERLLREDRIFDEKRLADERIKEDIRIQERLKKESEMRRKKQSENKKTSIAGSGTDMGTEVISIGEKSVKCIHDSIKDIKRMTEELKRNNGKKNINYKDHEKQVNGKTQEYLKGSQIKTQGRGRGE